MLIFLQCAKFLCLIIFFVLKFTLLVIDRVPPVYFCDALCYLSHMPPNSLTNLEGFIDSQSWAAIITIYFKTL